MDIQKVVFMLMAQDVDRASTFYTDVIGLEVGYRSPNWAELTHGDAVVALHGGGDGKVVTGPLERPGEPIMLAHPADTEGNSFELAQKVVRPE